MPVVKYKITLEEKESGTYFSQDDTISQGEFAWVEYTIVTGTTDQAIPLNFTTGLDSIESLLMTSDQDISWRQLDTDTGIPLNAGRVHLLTGTGLSSVLITNSSGSTATVKIAASAPATTFGATGSGTSTAGVISLTLASTGTDAAFSAATGNVTFALPSASATARGLVTTGTQTMAGAKTFSGALAAGSTLNVTGAATLLSTLDVTGAVTMASTLDVTGAVTAASFAGSGASLTSVVNSLAVGTTGTDIAVSGATGAVTLNIPSASATARGAVTTGTQTIAGAKTFTGNFLCSGVNSGFGSASSVDATKTLNVIDSYNGSSSCIGVYADKYQTTNANTNSAIGCLAKGGSSNLGANTLGWAVGLQGLAYQTGTGSLTNAASVFASAVTGTVTNAYGLYVEAQTAGSSVNKGIYNAGTMHQVGASEFDGTIQADAAVTFNAAHSDTPVTLTDAASIATNAALGNHFRVTLGDNRTLANPTNPANGQTCVWEIIQDGSGNRTLAYDTAFAFGADITGATLSTTASKRDFLAAKYNSTTSKWYVVSFIKGY